MGAGLEAVGGRCVLEAGWAGRVPALAHSGPVFPGETVPMLLPDPGDAALLARAIARDKLFGLLCPECVSSRQADLAGRAPTVPSFPQRERRAAVRLRRAVRGVRGGAGGRARRRAARARALLQGARDAPLPAAARAPPAGADAPLRQVGPGRVGPRRRPALSRPPCRMRFVDVVVLPDVASADPLRRTRLASLDPLRRVEPAP